MPEPKNYPDVILLTPHSTPILRKLFSYHARVYDLNAYEAISPGAGQIIWNMYQKEEEHQAEMKRLHSRLDARRISASFDIRNVFEQLKIRVLSPSGP